MPNRIVREAINASERVDQLSESAELFYRRLLNVVDDYGRFEARTDLLLIRTYPLRHDEIAPSLVIGWLHECQEVGLVLLYARAGRPYLELQDFRQQIRAKHSAFPAPTDPGCSPIAAAAVPIASKRQPRGRHAPKNPGDFALSAAHATQMRSKRAARAHSVVVVDECEATPSISLANARDIAAHERGELPTDPPPASAATAPVVETRTAVEVSVNPTKDELWAIGLEMLMRQGMGEKTARSFLGSLCSYHKEARVLAALKRAAVENPADLRGWLKAGLKEGQSSGQFTPAGERSAEAIRRWVGQEPAEGNDDAGNGPKAV
jgi:hypothetical protein